MSDKRIFPDLSRRKLVSGAVSLVAATLAGPASAQYRRRELDPYADPYGDELFGPDGRLYRRAPVARDRFYDTQVQEDYVEPYGRRRTSDPYGDYPYGGRARRPGEPATIEAPRQPTTVPLADGGFDYRRIYARVDGDAFPIPAFNFSRVRPEFLRREVIYGGREPAGTVVVDPRARHLHFVQGDGRAIRYGVGVGRQGFAWAGAATINAKQAWPDWYPPKEMIERDPKLARNLTELQSGIGMHGGPGNPLGARAMYLWQNNRDTLYRIHGTTEPWTIGTSVSSGCIRMVNQDAIDLYGRVGIGARVVVLG